jgi:hypothetical protein
MQTSGQQLDCFVIGVNNVTEDFDRAISNFLDLAHCEMIARCAVSLCLRMSMSGERSARPKSSAYDSLISASAENCSQRNLRGVAIALSHAVPLSDSGAQTTRHLERGKLLFDLIHKLPTNA